MKRIQRVALGLALLAALAGGGVSASAKSSHKQRALTGVVQSIDLRARTIEVREQGTGRVVKALVPEGVLLRTTSTNQPFMQIERLIPGITVSVAVR